MTVTPTAPPASPDRATEAAAAPPPRKPAVQDLEVGHLDIRVDENRDVLWRGGAVVDVKPCHGGHMNPRILIELDIDGNLDYVTGDLYRFGDLASINRALDVLTTVRDELTALYGDRPRRMGGCFARGDWETCELQHGHDGNHKFRVPKEERDRYTPAELRAMTTKVWEGSWHQ